MYENEIEYTVSITIDGTSVSSYVESVGINMSEDQYCNEVTISFNKDGWDLFHTLCNPETNWGTERIIVTINAVAFTFLLERRRSSVHSQGETFEVWGRSKAALLDLPYSDPISDTETSLNYWQYPVISRQASEIVNNLLSGTGVSVTFSINDFTVTSSNFSVDSNSPIEIIDKLAKVPGGRVRSGSDGNLILDYKTFSLSFTNPSLEFSDIDEIIQVDEEIDEPSGYNRVRVIGFQDTIDTGDRSITIEMVDDCASSGQEFQVKIYTSPHNLAYTFDTTIGTFFHIGEYDEIHTETIFFSEGQGSTSKPIYSVTSVAWVGDDLGDVTWEQGFDSMITDTEAYGVLEITYVARYTLYGVLIMSAGGAILFAEENE